MIKTFYGILVELLLIVWLSVIIGLEKFLKILTILEFMSTLIICLKIQEIVC